MLGAAAVGGERMSSAPDRLGRYEITEVLGTGAMGVVYKGFDPGIQRVVAIKTIRRDLIAGDRPGSAMLARFRNEARAAGKLAHPGIVAVYDYGEDESVAYIAMEFVEGNSLREYFNRGTRFSERDAVSIVVQLLEALAHAHERGVWHRDIKPANLIVMMNGRVKVADFGIARIETSELTQTGAVMGSPGYMAPEQYAAASIDHRADLFATGVVFYQLLTGTKPFVGSAEQVAYAICHTDAARPSMVDPGKGWERYDALIAKALAKRPEDRFASADDFRAALLAAHTGPVAASVSDETIITEILRPAAAVDAGSSPSRPGPKAARGAPATAPASSGARWAWLLGGGVAALAIAVVLWQVLLRAPAPAPPAAEQPVAAPPAPQRAPPEQEVVFWESVRNSNSRAELEAYLRSYPDGTFAPIARARIEALAAAEAKREAEATRAAGEKRAAEQRRSAGAKPQVASAAPAPPPRTAPAAAKWQAAMTCEAYEERAAWSGLVDVVSHGGVLVVQQGVADAPGSWTVRGTPETDGRLQLLGSGVSAIARSRGKPYGASLEGRLEGDRYQLAGRMGGRHCTMSVPRTDPAGGRGLPALAAPAPASLAAQRWKGAIACGPAAGTGPFNAYVDVAVSGSEFVLQRGPSGEPGSWGARGAPAADGTLKLAGAGISGLERTRGKPFPASFEGRFAGDHYLTNGRLGSRECTLSIALAGRAQ